MSTTSQKRLSMREMVKGQMRDGLSDNTPVGDDEKPASNPPADQQKKGATQAARDFAKPKAEPTRFLVDIDKLTLRPGFDRDPSEYEGVLFDEMVLSLKTTRGNQVPLICRPKPGGEEGEYEVIAGFTRYWALKAAGMTQADIKSAPYTDEDADLVHYAENQKRKNKSVYSQGLEVQTMLASDRYDGIRDLGRKLQADAGNLSMALTLVSGAPEGMWERVNSKNQLTWADAKLLVSAYKIPAFPEAVGSLSGVVEPKRIMGIARRVLREADKGVSKKPKKQPILKPMLNEAKDGSFTLQLPTSLPMEMANEILRRVEEYLASV